MKVHASALKHGVAELDAVQAAEWPLWIEPLDADGPPHRELRLGFDTGARLLATVVLIFQDGAQLIINAMPCRKKYLDLLPLTPHSSAAGRAKARCPVSPGVLVSP